MLHVSWQAQCSKHFPGKAVPVSDHPLGKELSPYNQPEPPLLQFHAILSGSIIGHKNKEIKSMHIFKEASSGFMLVTTDAFSFHIQRS